MNDNILAALYALPNGVAGWFGKRVSTFMQTANTKIIENIVQGVALIALALMLFVQPFGLIVALAIAAVKIKNIVIFITNKQ